MTSKFGSALSTFFVLVSGYFLDLVVYIDKMLHVFHIIESISIFKIIVSS